MKILLLVFLSFIITSSLIAQNFSSTDPAYIENVKLGEASLKSEKYDSCLFYYQEAFEIKQTSVLSTLRMAACAFSSEKNETYQEQLGKAFSLDWANAKNLFNNYPEFKYLEGSEMANDIHSKWKEEALAAGLDLELMEEFDQIIKSDQAQRQEMRPISEKYGWDSPKMDSLWKIQSYSDSVNTIRICEIIDKQGYPGKSVVGSGHQGTAFLVIQHADLEIQEKYLDIIKEAADAGEVRWASVALLIDRVNQRQGKKQIYGSQVSQDEATNEYFFGPIEQPYKVDSLRASVGLGPLNDYAKNWNFTYDPDKHVQRHKETEK